MPPTLYYTTFTRVLYNLNFQRAVDNETKQKKNAPAGIPRVPSSPPNTYRLLRNDEVGRRTRRSGLAQVKNAAVRYRINTGLRVTWCARQPIAEERTETLEYRALHRSVRIEIAVGELRTCDFI